MKAAELWVLMPARTDDPDHLGTNLLEQKKRRSFDNFVTNPKKSSCSLRGYTARASAQCRSSCQNRRSTLSVSSKKGSATVGDENRESGN